MPLLTDAERDFLDALRNGETANGYARRNHYSVPWAKWSSRKVRDKLGVHTIGEAIEMSELAGFETRLTGLEKQLKDGLEAITAAVTPAQRETATDNVRSIQDELRARGLTLGDLDEAAARKQDAKIDERVAAALAKRDADAEAARVEEEGEEEEAEDEPKRDGLGGVRNLLGGS